MRAPMLGERLDGLGSLVEVVNEGNVEGRLPQQLPALVRVCAQHTDDHRRHPVFCSFGGNKCSTRDHVATENAPEYVDEYFGDVPVGQDYPQRLGYLFLVRATSNVEEVGGRGAGSEGHVHRRHREAGTVDHAPDIAVESDVADAELSGLGFKRVLLFRVVELGEVAMAEHRVVVEVELGVGCEKTAFFRNDEGIDLDEGAVVAEEQVVELGHHRPLRS